MFDVAPLYAPALRHPDPPAEDFGGTEPTGSEVSTGPFLDNPTPTEQILITGAGLDAVNGIYKVQPDGTYLGPPGDGPTNPHFIILNVGDVWQIRLGALGVLRYYLAAVFPTKWTTVSGGDPPPIGNFI